MKKIKLRTQNTNNHIVSNQKEYSWVELEFDGKRVVFEITKNDDIKVYFYDDKNILGDIPFNRLFE